MYMLTLEQIEKKHKIKKNLPVWLGSLLDLLINIESSNTLISCGWEHNQPR
jgi:hypothetical protein